MKISDCIVELQAIMDEQGDLNLLIAKDDSGEQFSFLTTEDIFYDSYCVSFHPGREGFVSIHLG